MEKHNQNQQSYSFLALIVLLLLSLGFLTVINSTDTDDVVVDSTAIATTENITPATQRATLTAQSGFSGDGQAGRSYTFQDGFDLTIAAALPNLPSGVDYTAYYAGPQGTISLGRVTKQSGTYKVSHTSMDDLTEGYDTIRIRVEGTEGTVLGAKVPFTAMEGTFPDFES